MIIGRGYWILIWYGILALGVVGLLAGLYWGKRTRGKNFDEILRASGTIAISVGMLLMLYAVGGAAAQILMLVALGCFVAAFLAGRSGDFPFKDHRSDDDDAE